MICWFSARDAGDFFSSTALSCQPYLQDGAVRIASTSAIAYDPLAGATVSLDEALGI